MTQRPKTKARQRVAKSKTAARAPAKRTASTKPRRWSSRVTAHSDAMDLEPELFKRGAKAIAQSVKRSAEKSRRRKSTPFRSAMSMLTFYENRAGKNLTPQQETKLERAKDELRKLFDR